MSQEGPPADELVAAVQSRGPSAEELADAEDWANIRMLPEDVRVDREEQDDILTVTRNSLMHSNGGDGVIDMAHAPADRCPGNEEPYAPGLHVSAVSHAGTGVGVEGAPEYGDPA